MIKKWIREFQFWLGSRDFFAAHIRLVKSQEECTIMTGDNEGLTFSVYSSVPCVVAKLAEVLGDNYKDLQEIKKGEVTIG